MFSKAASSNRLDWRSDHSCCLSRLTSPHSTMKPPSLVGLRLKRSQRPSAMSVSLVACRFLSRRISICEASAAPRSAGVNCASGVPGLSSPADSQGSPQPEHLPAR